MNKSRFRLGMRVIAKGLVDGVDLKGKIGTIVDILDRDKACSAPIGVQFDEFLGSLIAHSCRNHGKDGYCRYGGLDEFDILGYGCSCEICVKYKEINTNTKAKL